MGALFARFVAVSLYMTPVILLLLLFMPRTGRRYKAGTRRFIWLMAALRLLVPVALPLRKLLSGTQVMDNLLDRIDRGAVAEALLGSVSGQAGGMAAGLAGPQNGVKWPVIWLAGTCLFLACHMAAYLVTMRGLRLRRVPVADAGTLRVFSDVKQGLGITREIGLYHVAGTDTPMLAGFWRPAVYLPARPPDAAVLPDVLAHELGHYRRGDLWLKLVLLLAHVLHWFNPVVYLMMRQTGWDMEMACDSDILRGADAPARRRYGLAVLAFVEQAPAASTYLTTHFYGGKRQMKQRFLDIVGEGGKRTGVLLTVVLLLVMALCAAPAGDYAFAAGAPQEAVTDDVAGESGPDTVGMAELPVLPEDYDFGRITWPVPGFYSVSAGYGYRVFDGYSDFHTGIDIGLDEEGIAGAPVVAVRPGTVILVNGTYTENRGYGRYVIIDHGEGVTTLYAHLSGIHVGLGDEVEAGQVIGDVGDTGFAPDGSHLHFEVREDGTHVDPVPYLLPA